MVTRRCLRDVPPIDFKHISILCLSKLCHGKQLSLSISCNFRDTLVVFADVFEEYYIFAIIIDPFQTSFLAPCILNTPCSIED